MTDLFASDTAPNTLLHWQVINVGDPKLQTGEVTVAYQGAIVPPPSSDRTYIFLLLEQPGAMTRQQVQGFVGTDCSPELRAGRCAR